MGNFINYQEIITIVIISYTLLCYKSCLYYINFSCYVWTSPTNLDRKSVIRVKFNPQYLSKQYFSLINPLIFIVICDGSTILSKLIDVQSQTNASGLCQQISAKNTLASKNLDWLHTARFFGFSETPVGIRPEYRSPYKKWLAPWQESQ